MLPLLKTRLRAVLFLVFMGGLTAAAMSLGALRMVPLKMLPFDNKNEILFLLDMEEGTTLERTDAVVRRIESVLASQPEVINYVSTVGASGPIDFNGMVRHYYLRSRPFQAEVRANFVGKKNRAQQSHGIGLRLRDELETLAKSENAKIQIVELPPGPPVLASLVAEVYGSDKSDYQDVLNSAATVADRMRREPGVAEVDDIREASVPRLVFEPDQEKAALSGISVTDIANTIQIALTGDRENVLRVEGERNPLKMAFRLPRELRSSQEDSVAVEFQECSWPIGTAKRDWKLAYRNGQPNDLSQESQASRVCLRRVRRTSTGRLRHRYFERPITKRAKTLSKRLRASFARLQVIPFQRQWNRLASWTRDGSDIRRRRRMEDHPGCVSRLGTGLRSCHAHDLHHLGRADGIVSGSDRRDACDSLDGSWRDAGLLFAQCHGESNSRRLCRSSLFHGHSHDWNDRVVGNRHP